MEPLKPNNEVYIKSLNMYGTVLRVRPGDVREPERMRDEELTREDRHTASANDDEKGCALFSH